MEKSFPLWNSAPPREFFPFSIPAPAMKNFPTSGFRPPTSPCKLPLCFK